MKILFDLQSLQSPDSANRGIGRYSLSFFYAFVDLAKKHEVHVLLNRNFTNNFEEVFGKIISVIPKENIHFFTPIKIKEELLFGGRARLISLNEVIREYLIQQLSVDVVIVTSLFDGEQGVYTSSIKKCFNTPTYVILYDLIPLVFDSQYLSNNRQLAEWYYLKLEDLKRADMLFAISQASAQDGMKYLALPGDRFLNINGDADAMFSIRSYKEEESIIIRKKYDIEGLFLMYTGGIDYRKNIEKLIEAYASLKAERIKEFQLVIVCRVSVEDRVRLEAIASGFGLDGRIIITGFVSDEELVWFYNNTSLFVFPSLYEGFGLPILEAMRCGAPVISSNNSSMLEVIGDENFTFDPSSSLAIAAKMEDAIYDEKYRELLIDNSRSQASVYSWKKSANTLLEYLESKHISEINCVQSRSVKKRLAYFSPIPSDRSGIADYSADILPSLSKEYVIDVFTKVSEKTEMNMTGIDVYDYTEFSKVSSNYDRILYHFGNSEYHEYMWDMVERHPGVVVLHDVFMGEFLGWAAQIKNKSRLLLRNLVISHGHSPFLIRNNRREWINSIWQLQYPISRALISSSCGVIVHSQHAYRIIENWFPDLIHKVSATRLSRSSLPYLEKNLSETVDNKKDVCVFGIVNEKKKCAVRIVEAWAGSYFAGKSDFRLVFVGQDSLDTSEKIKIDEILSINRCANVIFAGRVSVAEYRNKLENAYGAIQLRDQSRGESSIAILDCLAHDIPTIVNNHGSLAEIPDSCVCKIEDSFSREQLVSAMDRLFGDNSVILREAIKTSAHEYMQNEVSPEKITKDYSKFIEEFYSSNSLKTDDILYKTIRNGNFSEQARILIARYVAKNQVQKEHGIYIDITELMLTRDKSQILQKLREFILSIPKYRKTLFVYRKDGRVYMANTFVLKYFLKTSQVKLSDIEIDLDDTFDYLCLSNKEMNAAKEMLVGYRVAIKQIKDF